MNFVTSIYEKRLLKQVMKHPSPEHVSLALSETDLLEKGGFTKIKDYIIWCKQLGIKRTSIYIDVLETEEKVNVIAEMPGIEKEYIQLNATDLILDIETLYGNPKYSERIELPVKVDPQSAKATYQNGVLEVTFKRLESSSRTSIDIE